MLTSELKQHAQSLCAVSKARSLDDCLPALWRPLWPSQASGEQAQQNGTFRVPTAFPLHQTAGKPQDSIRQCRSVSTRRTTLLVCS